MAPLVLSSGGVPQHQKHVYPSHVVLPSDHKHVYVWHGILHGTGVVYDMEKFVFLPLAFDFPFKYGMGN
jgi:hypothetical protein